MKKYLIVLLASLFFADQAMSMGLFRSRQTGSSSNSGGTSTPTPTPSEPNREPASPVEPQYDTPALDSTYMNEEVAEFINAEVESQFGSAELLKVRDGSYNTSSDHCSNALEGKDRFVDQISFYVSEQLLNIRPEVAHLSSYYAVPSSRDKHVLTGLAHFPLCHSTKSSLTASLKKVPGSDVIEMLNEFEDKVNGLREDMLAGDEVAKLDLVKTWSKFMGCLSYVESLTTADASSSVKVAGKYAPSNYRKPAGVKFYEDPYQPAESKLNIGLYQFTPRYTGNIGACLKHWNQMYPQCPVNEKASQSDLIRMFGSSHQGMNAFCGVNKVAQTFAIQVNTTASKSTHPSNRSSSGLVPAAQRCVTPFIYAGYAYNHFGPLQNSTGANLKKLMSCVLK